MIPPRVHVFVRVRKRAVICVEAFEVASLKLFAQQSRCDLSRGMIPLYLPIFLLSAAALQAAADAAAIAAKHNDHEVLRAVLLAAATTLKKPPLDISS